MDTSASHDLTARGIATARVLPFSRGPQVFDAAAERHRLAPPCIPADAGNPDRPQAGVASSS